MKIILKFFLISFVFVALLSFSRIKPYTNFQDSNHKNFVPDTTTAIKIAEAIWLPLFGERIYNHKPYKVKLVGDTMWLVRGKSFTEKGGCPAIKIKKYDGKIIDAYFEK